MNTQLDLEDNNFNQYYCQSLSSKLIEYYMSRQIIQKKTVPFIDRTNLIEGISRKIKREFQVVVSQFQTQIKRKDDEIKQTYTKMCAQLEQLSILTNDCFNLFLGDTHSIVVNNRNPLLLVQYVKLFLQTLVEIKKEDIRQKRAKKVQNDLMLASYNQNNIYEFVAKKNIEFLQLEQQIKELKNDIILATKRTVIAQQMSKQVKQNADQLLKVYRQNFIKISDLLRNAQQKQSQLLQTNRFLNEQIQTLSLEFESYKKNYKINKNSKEDEKRYKQRLQKEYEYKQALLMKQDFYRNKAQKENLIK